MRTVLVRLVLALSWAALTIHPAAAQDQERFLMAVPGTNFVVSFTSPDVVQFQGQRQDDRFRFLAATDDQSIVVSFFAEPWTNGDATACRNEYSAQGTQNPAMVADSMEQLEIAGHPAASYLLEGDVQGQQVRSHNLNVYIVRDGRCLDFHVSRTPAGDPADEALVDIIRSLTVEDRRP